MPLRALARRFGRSVTLAQQLMVLAGVVLFASLGVAWFAFQRADANQQKSCDAALLVRDAIRDVLVDAQGRVNAAPAQTQQEQQRRDANDFYRQNIARLNRVRCPR